MHINACTDANLNCMTDYLGKPLHTNFGGMKKLHT